MSGLNRARGAMGRCAALAAAWAMLAGAAAAQSGRIAAVEIAPDGWYAHIEIEGMTPGGTYDFGLGPNHTAGPESKVVFSVVSMGFDDEGRPAAQPRTVYGTVAVRRPYPDQAQADETEVGGRVRLRIALSEYIYARDRAGAGNSGTDASVTIGAGFYTQGRTASRAVEGLRVENRSAAPYQPPIANWSAPPYQRVSGPFTLRCVAFHRDAREGRPVRAVRFSATDGRHTVERVVTRMTLDPAMADDAAPAAEYVAELDPAGFAPGAVITANFTVYPWTGEAPFTTQNGPPAPSPLPGPHPLLYDPAGGYGMTMARVDPGAAGEDGQVYDAAGYDYAAARPFATIAAAAQAIRAYNAAQRGRADVGGGVIELAAGRHGGVVGATRGAVVLPATYLTVRAGPGVAVADCVVEAASAAATGGLLKLENVTIGPTADRTFVGFRALWLHRCVFDSEARMPIVGDTTQYVTQGRVRQWAQGFPGRGSGREAACALFRGNRMTGPFGGVIVHVAMANWKSGHFPMRGGFTASTIATAQPMPILYNNRIMAWRTDAPSTPIGFSEIKPIAFIQNVFENTTPGPHGLGNFGSARSPSETNGYLIWHNTFVGQRNQVGYNSSAGTGTRHRRYWSMRNNYWEVRGLKSDVFGTDSELVGNWPIMYQVSCSGNVHGGVQSVASSGFHAYFAGVSSVQRRNETADYPRFVQPRRYAGGAVAAQGDGDYRLLPDSPLRGLAVDWVLPFDILGRPRPAVSDAGAFAAEDGR